MNIMSNFSYKDAKGQLVQVPVRYGDMTRQVGQILKKNSENTIPSAPFIACNIKDLQYDRPRMQDPTFISKIHIREREWDEQGQEYLNTQGSNYTVERIMPSPWLITFSADIWTTSTDMKLQIWEQLSVLFNPSFEIQTTDNYVDWTSLSVLELASQTWSSRSIPQGLTEDIDILNMTFTAPIWITPPAKVKKLGIITKIISNVYSAGQGSINSVYRLEDAVDVFGNISPDATITVTPGNHNLLVLNGVARLVKGSNIDDVKNTTSWYTILDQYPGRFVAGLSQLRFAQSGESEIIARISIDPSDDGAMLLNVDTDTIPSNTILFGRGTVDAIIDPEKFNPTGVAAGTRYLILEDVNINVPLDQDYQGMPAWRNADESIVQANANDIIEWNGFRWEHIFDSTALNEVIYITNAYTGTQYKWVDGAWSKTYEGVYDRSLWRLVL